MASVRLHSGARATRRFLRFTAALNLMFSIPLLVHGWQPDASPVVTDLNLHGLDDHFHGAPDGARFAENGDVVFVSGNYTGLFNWKRSTGVRSRVLQLNDEQPGFPGSVVFGIGNLRVNGRGHAAFTTSFVPNGGGGRGSILVLDGTVFHRVALSEETAPGTGGKTFLSFGPIQHNGQDQVAFQATFHPIGLGGSGIFLGSPAGPTTKIAVVGDGVPGGGTFLNLQLVGLNDAGQVAFLAGVGGGSIGFGLFLGSVSGVSLLAATGTVVPDLNGASFNLRSQTGNYLLNEAGTVAFAADVTGGGAVNQGIWIGNAGGGLTKLIDNTDSTGTSLGGTFGGSVTLRDYNGAGQALFQSNPESAASTHALFVKDLSHSATVIFARQSSPSPGGIAFDTTQSASLNGNGSVAFLASLSGSSPYGWFLRRGGDTAPVRIALEGEPTPAGGSFGFAGRLQAAQINATDHVLLSADILGPNAEGVFHYSPRSSLRAVVTSMDRLPSGAESTLRSYSSAWGFIQASGDRLVYLASLGGGGIGHYMKPLHPGGGTAREVMADNGPVPGGGISHSISLASVNVNNEVATASFLIVGAAMYPSRGNFVYKPGTGLEKQAVRGDPAPGSGGGQFERFPGVLRINRHGQVAFPADISGSASSAGFFMGSAGSVPQVVARIGDAVQWGGNLVSIGTQDHSLNDDGKVAFRATVTGGIGVICIGQAGSPPVKVAATGDTLLGGRVTWLPNTFKMNAAGQVAYVANVSYDDGRTLQGVFLGTPGGTQYKIAFAGENAPGTAGGKFGNFRDVALALNNSGQVGFWASLTGVLLTTGYFLGSAAAAPAPRLLEGQLLPGGGLAGVVVPAAQVFQLNDQGEMAMSVAYVTGAADLPRVVIADANGVLRHFASVGEQAHGTSSRYGFPCRSLAVNPDGKFFFHSILVGGPAKTGIFWNGHPAQ